MSAQVFITGLGMVTSLGADVETSWRRALAGESGIAPIESFDAKTLPIAGAGEVSGGGALRHQGEAARRIRGRGRAPGAVCARCRAERGGGRRNAAR